MFRIGFDIGSTTIKCVVVDTDGKIIFSSYERHLSQIKEKSLELLNKIKSQFPQDEEFFFAISGSAGMGLSEGASVPFVQEVYATRAAANRFLPDSDVIIELGGEDAKILFLNGNCEVRMNGSCAGGTGAFIDQMATLLKLTPTEMNEYAANHQRIYTIASRCGVFAKSDVQPLLNQGANKNDISASIFDAVVNQTIGGLAQGRPIEGNVVYLGGPLTFFPTLRTLFDKALGRKGVCPENSLYYVALGAALCADKAVNINSVLSSFSDYSSNGDFNTLTPLFANEEEYESFKARHERATVEQKTLSDATGDVYLGIDAGSTTVKTVVVDENENILYSTYSSNSGNPVPVIRNILQDIYTQKPDIHIASSAVTGYGEDIIKNAFNIDLGIVETIAHFTAAKKFMPDVEFIIDIGGQDMKCFKIKNGTIDNIYLNEACSSGCGSFLQTFANALGYGIEAFSQKGLFAKNPVDLGSRCTVFMNSSVKQAQKDGATIEDISAGLSMSVVKNAIYKVIRPSSKEALGKRIVVQGGTFLNDAVLRAFEQELGIEVVRPSVSALMGAYGAALYAKGKSSGSSTVITPSRLASFEHSAKTVNCSGCTNNCLLTVNTFEGGRRFVSGNRCEKPVTKKSPDNSLNLYAYKNLLLSKYKSTDGGLGKIGIPMGLNMYEMYPFWHTFFTSLGFEVVTSPPSSRDLYLKGQATIPSDTVCFPAKLMHGHIKALCDMGLKTIFYPCMTYNFDESASDNHYNCPVVAYYPEVIESNCNHLEGVDFIYNYIGIHRKRDFPKKIYAILNSRFPSITLKAVQKASVAAYREREDYLARVRSRGKEIIRQAREEKKHIIVLSGRPYHIDGEINHGIDKLITAFDTALITEDAVSHLVSRIRPGVLDQWTYHSRLYRAAQYVTSQKDMDLVQLVSFGCGVDAITTDEVRSILEKGNKIYTQIKIDEITNLGAVKIRLRSLLATI
ncbi:MAG: 2-hydroxyacyl-CoA dehydratase [Clostridia bacterium]|nr:2-hydroxyacyl-CoA dehydratase [Clostridia bacterium]